MTTTKERLHQIIEGIPESELPTEAPAEQIVMVFRMILEDPHLLGNLAQHYPELVQRYIENSPKWQREIQEASEDSKAGRGVRASDFFAARQK